MKFIDMLFILPEALKYDLIIFFLWAASGARYIPRKWLERIYDKGRFVILALFPWLLLLRWIAPKVISWRCKHRLLYLISILLVELAAFVMLVLSVVDTSVQLADIGLDVIFVVSLISSVAQMPPDNDSGGGDGGDPPGGPKTYTANTVDLWLRSRAKVPV